jgi:hypothetical protein
MLTQEIKSIALEQRDLYLQGQTEDMEVSRADFDLALFGGIFHRRDLGDRTVWVYWVNTGEIQVRVSVDMNDKSAGEEHLIHTDDTFECLCEYSE